MRLSSQQQAAVDKFKDWWKNKDKQVFYIAGFAGTGKSSIARYLADYIPGKTLFGSYTGKAALVMRNCGCADATTIHRMIYMPKDKSTHRLTKLKRELIAAKEQELPDPFAVEDLEKQIKAEQRNLKQPAFDRKDSVDVREASLIVIDECFAPGTLVDTPKGCRKIESICPGDSILNASGCDTVLAIGKKKINEKTAKISIRNEEIFVSKDHPFFTQRGLVLASQLKPGDLIPKSEKAMRFLQERNTSTSESFFSKVLQRELFNAVVAQDTEFQEKNLHCRKKQEVWRREEKLVTVRRPKSKKRNGSNTQYVPIKRSSSTKEDLQKTKGDWAQTASAGRERKRSYSGRKETIRSTSRISRRIYSSYRNPRERWVSKSLQAGRRSARSESVHRDRWILSLFNRKKETRRKKDREANFIRVDSVEILEQRDPRLDRFRDAKGDIYFYDLQASKHSSYSVSGGLVHNCSMVGERMGQDLLSFDIPILVLGDPAQLPPIRSGGFFTNRKPDALLTEIHRQAESSPVLQLATMIRQGDRPQLGEYGSSRVLPKGVLDLEDLLDYNQVLVGRNKTRKDLNNQIRQAIGRTELLPEEGDKLICLRNDHDLGLMNGSLWTTVDRTIIDDDSMVLVIRDETRELVVEAHRHYIENREDDLSHWAVREAQCFDYGYCITVHKSQGSQWDNVLIIDESREFGKDEFKHRYTAVTRAVKSVTIVDKYGSYVNNEVDTPW